MMMKHVFSFVLLGLGAAALGGCPIYSNDGQSHRVCMGVNCYSCPDPSYSSNCSGFTCYDATDCPSGYACSSSHQCQLTDGVPPSPVGGALCSKPADCPAGTTCGADNKCHTGDCATSGCPSNFVCKLSAGVPACQPVGNNGGTSACKSDTDCPTPAGSKCLSGACVAPPDQCADATQCPGGSQCVQGACTPSCSAAKPCPTGYACDAAKGVCTGTSGACTNTSQCSGSAVCVQQHCVDPCGAGATCPSGLVCVDGGCTPNQAPVFTCTTDGAQDKCQAGSLCLRHSCYISCDQDAGADACKAADTFNVCKSVTTTSGAHSVCGSATNLGTECDPTVGQNCASPLICIDGFCR